jgi:hypothetical protein
MVGGTGIERVAQAFENEWKFSVSVPFYPGSYPASWKAAEARQIGSHPRRRLQGGRFVHPPARKHVIEASMTRLIE